MKDYAPVLQFIAGNHDLNPWPVTWDSFDNIDLLAQHVQIDAQLGAEGPARYDDTTARQSRIFKRLPSQSTFAPSTPRGAARRKPKTKDAITASGPTSPLNSGVTSSSGALLCSVINSVFLQFHIIHLVPINGTDSSHPGWTAKPRHLSQSRTECPFLRAGVRGLHTAHTAATIRNPIVFQAAAKKRVNSFSRAVSG
jgi:hypothetical protein